jgi:hypothetical protein
VKRPNALLILLLAAVLLALPACRGRETAAGGEATETIAPAAPQPAPTGTDAMTQTVDIEEGRTDAEGGTQAPLDTALTTAPVTGTPPQSATAPQPSTTTR